MKEKIALFCNVPKNRVLQNLDVQYLYEAPLAMEEEQLAQVVCEALAIPVPNRISKNGRNWYIIFAILQRW